VKAVAFQTVFSLYGARRPLPEEEKSWTPSFYALTVFRKEIPTLEAALPLAMEQMDQEDFDHGYMVAPWVPNPEAGAVGWAIYRLDAVDAEDYPLLHSGKLTGFLWERLRPPRAEWHESVAELEQLWRKGRGTPAMIVREEKLEPSEIRRVRLAFRERGVY
jgi:hypothetical protein